VNYVPVKSSTLDAVAYDEGSSTLAVRFKNGSEYEYPGVSESIFQGILAAPSPGKYFQAHVKDAGFRFRKVR
jgi:hypothetical protein